MESNQDTRSQASYISVAASLTAKLRCCFRGDTTIITGSYNPRGDLQGNHQGNPDEDIPIAVALEEAPHAAAPQAATPRAAPQPEPQAAPPSEQQN